MKQHLHVARAFISNHKKEFIIGLAVVLSVLVVVVLVALFIYNNKPKVVYEPAKACDLFTPSEAQDLLGDKVINVNTNNVAVSGNTATSKCSYTDSNPGGMTVAALAIRSGVNDDGVEQNRTEFAASRQGENLEIVKGLGESAFFNKELGQLNVLEGRRWFIISYGLGSAPEANTVEKSTELARKVLR